MVDQFQGVLLDVANQPVQLQEVLHHRRLQLPLQGAHADDDVHPGLRGPGNTAQKRHVILVVVRSHQLFFWLQLQLLLRDQPQLADVVLLADRPHAIRARLVLESEVGEVALLNLHAFEAISRS